MCVPLSWVGHSTNFLNFPSGGFVSIVFINKLISNVSFSQSTSCCKNLLQINIELPGPWEPNWWCSAAPVWAWQLHGSQDIFYPPSLALMRAASRYARPGPSMVPCHVSCLMSTSRQMMCKMWWPGACQTWLENWRRRPGNVRRFIKIKMLLGNLMIVIYSSLFTQSLHTLSFTLFLWYLVHTFHSFPSELCILKQNWILVFDLSLKEQSRHWYLQYNKICLWSSMGEMCQSPDDLKHLLNFPTCTIALYPLTLSVSVPSEPIFLPPII